MPDLDAAIAFYRDTFGVVERARGDNEEQGVREAMLAVGDGATRIQLLAPLNERVDDREVPRPQRARRAAGGLHRRGHRRGRRDRCASAGCDCSTTQPRRGTSDSRVNFIHPKDAGGVLVELVEPAPEGSTVDR